MAKPELNLSNLTPEQVIELARRIRKAMTGNPNFPSPTPPLAELDAAINRLEIANSECNTAQHLAAQKLKERDEAKETIRTALWIEGLIDYTDLTQG